MNVVLFGASGMIGSRILQELLQRGHAVTAVVRNPEKITAPAMQVVKGDVTDESSVASRNCQRRRCSRQRLCASRR